MERLKYVVYVGLLWITGRPSLPNADPDPVSLTPV